MASQGKLQTPSYSGAWRNTERFKKGYYNYSGPLVWHKLHRAFGPADGTDNARTYNTCFHLHDARYFSLLATQALGRVLPNRPRNGDHYC
jgi:hypothetical protein